MSVDLRPRAGAPSYWQLDAPLPSWPALDRDTDADVLVVGAGLAGLGVARALVQRGRRVLVLDAIGPGSGASGRNAGFVLAAHVAAFPALRARVGDAVVQALLALSSDTHERIASLAERASHARRGCFVLAERDAEADALEVSRSELVERGVLVERARVPTALAGYCAALFLPADGEVHPVRLLGALAAGLEGRIGTVTRIDAEAHVAHLGALRVSYRTLVLATNAWTSALEPTLRVAPARAQMLVTEPLPHALPAPSYARGGFDYFRQLDDGRVLCGGRRDAFADAERTSDPNVSDEVQAALDTLLRTHLPFARDARIERRWAGTMGFTPPELPYVGALGDDRFAVLGFTGHGLGIALGCAGLCATEIAGEAWPANLGVLRAALSPRRA